MENKKFAMNTSGPISGQTFHWFLVYKHEELLQNIIIEYLNQDIDPDKIESYSIDEALAVVAAKYKNYVKNHKMLAIFYGIDGKLRISSTSKMQKCCPLSNHTLSGEKVIGISGYYAVFFLYKNKKYEYGDTSLCSECVNQIHCFTQGNPSASFESIYDTKNKKLKSSV